MNETSETPDTGADEDAHDVALGWDDRMDILRAGLTVVAEISVEDVDLRQTPDGDWTEMSDMAVEAQLIGTALAGLVGWVLELPAESSIRRDLIVQVNDQIFTGGLTIQFNREPMPTFDLGLAHAEVPQ